MISRPEEVTPPRVFANEGRPEHAVNITSGDADIAQFYVAQTVQLLTFPRPLAHGGNRAEQTGERLRRVATVCGRIVMPAQPSR